MKLWSLSITWSNWFVLSNGIDNYACTSVSFWSDLLDRGTPKNSLFSKFSLNVCKGLCFGVSSFVSHLHF